MSAPIVEYIIVDKYGKRWNGPILDGQQMRILDVSYKEAEYGEVSQMLIRKPRVVMRITPVENSCHSCGTPVPKFGDQCDECRVSR